MNIDGEMLIPCSVCNYKDCCRGQCETDSDFNDMNEQRKDE